MWSKIASLLLRYRFFVLIALGGLTVFMGSYIPKLRLVYEFDGLLPETDSTFIDHERFLEHFGAEGNLLVIGVEDSKIYEAEGFQAWFDLAEEIRDVRVDVDGKSTVIIDSVFCVTHAFTVEKDTSDATFRVVPLASDLTRGGPALSQERVDEIYAQVRDLPFYDGVLFSEKSDATLMMVFIDSDLFNSEDRGTVVEDVTALADKWSEKTGMQVYMSGLPFIRIQMTNKVKGEIGWFIGAALLVTFLLLLLFFRNFITAVVCLSVVAIGVVWSTGSIALFDFPITLLMSLIPPLIIVIGVPNCIYLVNKYHAEYKRHGNKAMALQRMITKVGNATLLTNITTAMGFATFMFTKSDILKDFGTIAALNIMAVFVISITLIPALLTLLPPPAPRQTSHLDRKWVFKVVQVFVTMVQKRRGFVYLFTIVILGLSVAGMVQMKTTGNIVDDLPDSDRVLTDLNWIEENFNGVMPFEMLIDSGEEGEALSLGNLKRIERMQSLLAEYPEFSRSMSAVDATKFAMQALNDGKKSSYRLPISNREKMKLRGYTRRTEEKSNGSANAASVTRNFLDSTTTITRISAQMADIGTLEMDALIDELRPRIDSIFPPAKYDVTLTGTSIVFLEGTHYLVNNLAISISLAILVIALVMALLFTSVRMVFIALLPNILPLLFTAGVMGWVGIPIKPSTILVFSIAFGISVDDTIHFLAKYRQELQRLNWNIKKAVILAVEETGVSMMYTSIVLFSGFMMFAMSEFDGTRSLGVLVSVTLFVAMFANLLLLPSLLLSFEQFVTTKAFQEPLMQIIDEDEDIDLEELRIEFGLTPGKGDENHEEIVKRRSESDRLQE
ncbi:MAG TPA: RND family transporter [Flavobacteriales bacterium]|nr:RND family transporter [Flavobacteriales bacterium]HIO16252.1 RND family transporter [Flavobacteriales bacterium]